MLRKLRQHVTQHLWETYCATSLDMQTILKLFPQQNKNKFLLDHFAVIDLPGPYSGIPVLSKIFSAIGYVEKGKDYLAEKQNDFAWYSEIDCEQQHAQKVLPQIVIADFRLDIMPNEIKLIIEKYSKQTKSFCIDQLKQLIKKINANDEIALSQCFNMLTNYFSGRDWPMPTKKEFNLVKEFNELLAWVLVFGRKPNHFTLSIHLLSQFKNLASFHKLIEEEIKLTLNQEGGIVKGGEAMGIAQSSTMGIVETVKTIDGEIIIPTGFVEFAWRFPKNNNKQKPILWNDYFTGFVAKHADRVIESLYVAE